MDNLTSKCDADIEHPLGKKIAHVNALIREPVGPADKKYDTRIETYALNACEEGKMSDIELRRSCLVPEVRRANTRKGHDLKKRVIARSKNEESEVRDFELTNGILYKRVDEKLLFVVPQALRKTMVIRYHDRLLRSHSGLKRTAKMMSVYYHFPEVKRYVK